MTPLEQAARPTSLAIYRYIEQSKRERAARERIRWASLYCAVWVGFVLALYCAVFAGVMVGAI